MNNKIKYVILVVLLVLALGLLGVFWYLMKDSQTEKQVVVNEPIVEETQKTEPVVTNTPIETPQTTKVVALTDEEKEQAQLLKMVGSFIERYGSYSNQTDFENIVDLLPFMSVSMQNWANNFVDQKRKTTNTSDPYYGVTTKVLKTEMVNFGSDIAKVKTSSQKSEMVGSNYNARVFYQDDYVELVKEGGLWKVDRISK